MSPCQLTHASTLALISALFSQLSTIHHRSKDLCFLEQGYPQQILAYFRVNDGNGETDGGLMAASSGSSLMGVREGDPFIRPFAPKPQEMPPSELQTGLGVSWHYGGTVAPCRLRFIANTTMGVDTNP